MIDASGNMWDWTDSWFDARAAARVVRGGSRGSPAGYMRCANRLGVVPGNRNPYFGFRPARSVSS
jgi:formylglycine-generating enzyme required for sulfatase activity